MKITKSIIASGLVLLSLPALALATPASIDKQGSFHYNYGQNFLVVSPKGKITLNGKLIANCASNTAQDFEDKKGNEVSCIGNKTISIELADGSEIDIKDSLIVVEDPEGNDYILKKEHVTTTSTEILSTDIVHTNSNSASVQTSNSHVAVSDGNINVSAPSSNSHVAVSDGSINVSAPSSNVAIDNGKIKVSAPGININIGN